MDPRPSPPTLSPSPMDPEVFRRVWQRVMPDQKGSPIVPAPPNPRKPVPPPPATPPMPPVDTLLSRYMEQLSRGIVQANYLIRRYGNRPLLLRLLRERQQGLRRLSAAHFLATGRRFQPSGQAPAPPAPLPAALREQFFLESQWGKDFLLASDSQADPELRELFRSLSHQAHGRAAEIRRQLEQM